jgi:hypothetical protein
LCSVQAKIQTLTTFDRNLDKIPPRPYKIFRAFLLRKI